MGGDSLPAGQWGWVGTVTSTPAKLPKSSSITWHSPARLYIPWFLGPGTRALTPY